MYKAVIFDWAGTMIDFGSFAPTGVFVEAFRRFNVDVTTKEARAPMGMPKWDHIDAMLKDPRISRAWMEKHRAEPSKSDVDRIYEVFVPMNEEVVADYAALVPGAAATVAFLRRKGLKIGSTTGYTRSIMRRVLPVAAAQGYVPDNLVCADDLPEGRPGPLMMYKCFVDLVVYPPASVIKVDDTEPGIAEGVAAGCLAVGVTLSGNYVGKAPQELSVLGAHQVEDLRQAAVSRLVAAGAHHVIDTVADLPALIARLDPALDDGVQTAPA